MGRATSHRFVVAAAHRKLQVYGSFSCTDGVVLSIFNLHLAFIAEAAMSQSQVHLPWPEQSHNASSICNGSVEHRFVSCSDVLGAMSCCGVVVSFIALS